MEKLKIGGWKSLQFSFVETDESLPRKILLSLIYCSSRIYNDSHPLSSAYSSSRVWLFSTFLLSQAIASINTICYTTSLARAHVSAKTKALIWHLIFEPELALTLNQSKPNQDHRNWLMKSFIWLSLLDEDYDGYLRYTYLPVLQVINFAIPGSPSAHAHHQDLHFILVTHSLFIQNCFHPISTCSLYCSISDLEILSFSNQGRSNAGQVYMKIALLEFKIISMFFSRPHAFVTTWIWSEVFIMVQTLYL